ncbi:alpha-glucosidase [Cryptococcus neoformans c45]|nr:alpha-glucosidase [Cryptococcus neoformans var. grubii c45]
MALLVQFLTLLLPILAGAIPAYRPAAHQSSQPPDQSSWAVASQQPDFSGDVTQCKGYAINSDSVTQTSTGGISAQLDLITYCSAYGTDIPSLTLSVEYETSSRLHVHIYDTPVKQFQIDDNILPRPKRTLFGTDSADKSDLKFDYENSPFAFWVTRKSDGEVLFDTRKDGIPIHKDPSDILGSPSNYTVMPAHPLVFEDQYLQLSSKLPVGANIYGLGEAVSGSGYRRNSSSTVQTMWARDIADPVDENLYGTHPFYMEVRYNETSCTLASHGVFLRNSNGMDVVLRDGAIQYRAIGGTLDLYFVSGPSPNDVTEQYVSTIGLPQPMPEWSFGFHLCRWGYTSANETLSVVNRMRDAGIPLETQWNDIDWMRSYREFQFDQNYGEVDYRNLVETLHSRNQHYIPIFDAAIGHPLNATDRFDVYDKGHELGVWMRNPDGTEYVGAVWPTFAVFPDWFHPKMQEVWTEAFYNYSLIVDFDGIWLDMNEPSSFVDGSASNSTMSLEDTTVVPPDYSTVAFPTDWPEGYSNVTGISGNVTVDGALTYGADGNATKNTALRRSNLISRDDVLTIPYVDVPPYPINNGNGRLSVKTVSPNATHYGGLQEYSVHNLWGLMEEEATNNMFLDLKPGKRPFMVSRSTFAGSGRKTAHWLGDNFSTFAYMKRSIQGVLQFNLLGIPMVGPDVCGFNGNTDEELCNRWMQLGAFFPFFRNHNIKSAISQEPYVWDSVRDASIKAINARYQMLPYWSTLFAKSSLAGTPAVIPLFHEFPSPNYLDNDYQFLIGPSVLVTPVLQPNESTVVGQFPTMNDVFWVDWWTHCKLDTSSGEDVTLDLPLGNIGVHVRSGSALLLYDEPGYTVKETKDSGYAILVVLDGKGYAEGDAKIDDGESLPVTEQTCLTFTSTDSCKLSSTAAGSYTISGKLKTITIVGVWTEPSEITLNGSKVKNNQIEYDGSLGRIKITGLVQDLNSAWELMW